ncbi:MAG: NADH-quinone oxidoreductase subunit J [Acidobacteria bacterium]|nr:NADH-quinone oxidoreductase subunit J [Acidobacteriota bacterium]
MTFLIILVSVLIALLAITVVSFKHPISSAISLLVAFLLLAVFYLLYGAEFVAAVQVLVYAGGIMVLYLMGVMFTDNEWIKITRQTHLQAWLALVLVLVFFAYFGHKLYHSEYPAQTAPQAKTAVSGKATNAEKALPYLKRETNPRSVSVRLFSDYIYAFEVASVLLTIAVVGGVFLAKKEV